jgi:hypothetical protein
VDLAFTLAVNSESGQAKGSTLQLSLVKKIHSDMSNIAFVANTKSLLLVMQNDGSGYLTVVPEK